MLTAEFVERLEAGEFPNIIKAETLPAHFTDRRGDRCLAVIVGESEDAGAIVDLIWEDATLEQAKARPFQKFAWVNSGWLTPGDDHSQYGPSLRIVCEDRGGCFTDAKSTAKELRRIAELLDPQEDDE